MPVAQRKLAALSAFGALVLAACSSTSSTGAASQSSTTSSSTSSSSSSSSSGTSTSSSSSGGSSGSSGSSGSGSTSGGSGGSSLDQVCAAGAKEGVVDYASNTDTDLWVKEIADFNKKYPDIKVNFTMLEPQDVVQKIVPEKQAGHKVDFDAVNMDPPTAAVLFDNDMVADFDWSSVGIASDLVETVHGKRVFRAQRTLGGIGYNTSMISEKDLPKTWADLASSKYAGKFIVDPRGKFLSPLAIEWGEQKALDWYKQLLDQGKPVVLKGITDSLVKVGAGEIPMTTSAHDAEVKEQQGNGAPVKIHYMDLVPTQDHLAILLNTAQHPNAAKCLLGWFGQPDGGLAQQLKYEFKSDVTRPSDLPADSKLVVETSTKDVDLESKVAKEFAKMTTGG